MLSNIERELLRHYSERERIISGQRTSEQRRLLALGYILEQRNLPLHSCSFWVPSDASL